MGSPSIGSGEAAAAAALSGGGVGFPITHSSLPWSGGSPGGERGGKSASSSRGILKNDSSWIPSSSIAPNGTGEEGAGAGASQGIGHQFVSKVKAKATNLFTLSR